MTDVERAMVEALRTAKACEECQASREVEWSAIDYVGVNGCDACALSACRAVLVAAWRASLGLDVALKPAPQDADKEGER